MKALLVAIVVISLSIEAISALKCMQGLEMDKRGSGEQPPKQEKPLEITECGATSALASTALLFLVKPNTLSFPSGDYKCYHLKYQDKADGSSGIIKGCIYKSLNVCDGKFSSNNVEEVFCSQCEMDGCNSGSRFGLDLKLFSLTLVAFVAYLLK